MTSPRANRICLICGAKAESAHFGVVSCRACAAFFKRAVVLSRNYICRQSTDSCTVSKETKFTCRRCRWVKCIAAGMKPESVSNTPNYRVSDADAGLDVHMSESSESFDLRPSKTLLLDMIGEQFRLLEQISTRSDAYVMSEAFGDRMITRVLQNGHIPATIGLLNQCVRASHQPMVDFISLCFPEISDFDESETWLVLKNFMTSRFIFDGVYRAQKSFPGNDKIFMMSFHTFIDLDCIDFYLSDLETKDSDTKASARIWREMISKCISDWLGPLLVRAAIDQVETMAIYGLLCWPSYLPNATVRVMEVCYKYHLRIFQELHYHYKKVGIDYSSRVAHLTSILLSVQAAIQRLKEDMEIYRLLDVYSGEEVVYTVVK